MSDGKRHSCQGSRKAQALSWALRRRSGAGQRSPRATTSPANSMILTADQPCEIAYIILDGTLEVSIIQSNGRELTLALLGPGEIVGELALADRAARSADVTAL